MSAISMANRILQVFPVFLFPYILQNKAVFLPRACLTKHAPSRHYTRLTGLFT